MNAATSCPATTSACSDSSPQLKELFNLEIDHNLIAYIVHCTIETVDYALDRPCSSSFRGRPIFCPIKYGTFYEFVSKIIYRSRVKTPILLLALVYIERARAHLKITIERWACERVLMGALVIAGKYSSDYAMKNVLWAKWSSQFLPCHIGRIEREFLNLLDYELGFSEADILAHHELLMSLNHPSAPGPSSPPTILEALGRTAKRARSVTLSCEPIPASTSQSALSPSVYPSSSSTLVQTASALASSSTITPSSYHQSPKILLDEDTETRPVKRLRVECPNTAEPHIPFVPRMSMFTLNQPANSETTKHVPSWDYVVPALW